MVTIMAGAAVSWYSRQQEVVALSQTEIEYISLCSGTEEKIWTRRPINDAVLVADVINLTEVLTDNQGGMSLVENEAENRRSRHIDVWYHFTRNAKSKKQIMVNYCCTDNMTADIMTKPLGPIKCNEILGNVRTYERKGLKSLWPREGVECMLILAFVFREVENFF